jgi:hypothetical protein
VAKKYVAISHRRRKLGKRRETGSSAMALMANQYKMSREKRRRRK